MKSRASMASSLIGDDDGCILTAPSHYVALLLYSHPGFLDSFEHHFAIVDARLQICALT